MHKKILIVDTVPYERAPYIKNYEEVFNKKYIEYDLFLWNRLGDSKFVHKDNQYIFNIECPFGRNKLKKIYPMFMYQKKLREIIRQNKYTHLVLIDSLAPIMISDLILKEYRKRYILDIRDYTYEKYTIYKNRLMQLARSSFFTCISSKGFMRFLDKYDYVVSHNISNENNFEERYKNIKNKKTINIGFVGSVRYFNENSTLIKKLRDTRLKIQYSGTVNPDCPLEQYCKDNGFSNVLFTGSFTNSDKPEIYKNIDIINSIYGTFSLEVTTALPNRLYDALLFKKPILASKGTYLGEIVDKYGIGLSVDVLNENIQEILFEYIDNIDEEKLNFNFDNLLGVVVNEQKEYIEKIHQFVL